MRARRRIKNNAKQEIQNYQKKIIIDKSTFDNNLHTDLKKNLQSLIVKSKKQEVLLEIGMGNGEFLNELAIRNPSSLCIGIELKEERILTAIKESIEKKIQNTLYIQISALFLDEIFEKQQITDIYMNFPDPWPKKKHVKHRMTSDKFIEKYKIILSKNGLFTLKTDNLNMFNFTLEQLKQHNFQIIKKNNNLGNTQENIITKFENRYRKQNKKINLIIAKQAKMC